MLTETVENYLKAIYTLQQPQLSDPVEEISRGASARANRRQVSIGDLAAAVGVTSGTATTMVKRLAADRLAKHERYGGVVLTAKGERLALSVLRRHRLVETFLVRTLGMGWGEVHEEARAFEHALSDRLLERFDHFLGYPAVDPHGDPIPDADGRLRETALITVARSKPGVRVRLARVLDQRAEFLQFLDKHGLHIDSVLTVEDAEPGAGTITIQVEHGGRIAIGDMPARNLLVEPVHGSHHAPTRPGSRPPR